MLALQSSGVGCSPFWQSLLGVNHLFQQYSIRIVGDGRKTLFWKDRWHNQVPLASTFPRLFLITFSKDITLHRVKTEGLGCIQLRRRLVGETIDQWEQLQLIVDSVVLSSEPDSVRWTIGNTGVFTVRSLYIQLTASAVVQYRGIWTSKPPSRSKSSSGCW